MASKRKIYKRTTTFTLNCYEDDKQLHISVLVPKDRYCYKYNYYVLCLSIKSKVSSICPAQFTTVDSKYLLFFIYDKTRIYAWCML